jgi:flagellar hook-associated protein 2
MAVSGVRQGTVSNDIASLAEALMAQQRLPLQALQDRRTELNNKSSALATLRTRLVALRSELDSLAQSGTLSGLAGKAAISSDDKILTASAGATAADGVVSITVGQLARRATHASDVYGDAGTTISGAGTGTFTFTVTIAGTAHDVSVAVNAGDSDKTVLDNVAAAITTAVGTKGSAVRVQTASGQSRLSISSADTGTANKITFTDTDGLLARLGIVHGSATAATNTTGGYVYDDLGNHELDATLVVDGLTYYRDSNTVSDLLGGVTLNLKATSASPVTVKIQPDTDKVTAKLNSFIAKYNDVLDYLKQQTAVDAKAGTRGVLSLDSTYRLLGSSLKQQAAAIVGSQAAGKPNSLPSIGIRADADGKLSVADATKLSAAVASDPAAVQSLFNASDGIATTLEAFVERYTKSTGAIAQSTTSINARLSTLNTQITNMETSLAKRQAALEDQLARQQSMLTALSRQASQVNSFFTQGF